MPTCVDKFIYEIYEISKQKKVYYHLNGMKLSRKDIISWQKTLSDLCTNLAAGWFGVVFITPVFDPLSTLSSVMGLLRSLGYGILFLYLAYKLERITK